MPFPLLERAGQGAESRSPDADALDVAFPIALSAAVPRNAYPAIRSPSKEGNKRAVIFQMVIQPLTICHIFECIDRENYLLLDRNMGNRV